MGERGLFGQAPRARIPFIGVKEVQLKLKDALGKNQFIVTSEGIGNESGTTRFEWEKEISKQEAENLLKICEVGIIDKKRYYVRLGDHIFEVDVFGLDNKGLVMAEVELKHEDDLFEKPDWLGQEVTGQKQYYNSNLIKNPFKNW